MSLGKVLPSSPCVSCDVAEDAQPVARRLAVSRRHRLGITSATLRDTRCRATQSILYLGASSGTGYGFLRYQRQIDQTRLKIDAQASTGLAVAHLRNEMTIRLSLTASSPHSNAGHAGGNPID